MHQYPVVDFFNIYLQVTLDMVHADVTATEEQNSTETAKTYKVNCDKRNITGMDNFTVQVLNASQVFMLPSEAHWLRDAIKDPLQTCIKTYKNTLHATIMCV